MWLKSWVLHYGEDVGRDFDWDDVEEDVEEGTLLDDTNEVDNLFIDIDEEVFQEIEAEYYHSKQFSKRQLDDFEEPMEDNGVNGNDLEIKVGEYFNCKKDLKDRLSLMALQRRFQIHVQKSDKKLYVVRCIDPSCTFFCRGSALGNTGLFEVKKYYGHHTWGMKLKHNHHTHASSSVITDHIMSSFNTTGTCHGPHAAEIQDIMKKMGVAVSYDKANRARLTAIDRIRDTVEESYNRIHGYMYMLERMNTRTVTHVEVDSNRRFKYCFISLGAWRNGMQFLRKVITVDGTHLGSKYRYTLLVIVAQDRNRQIYPVAFAVVDSENDNSWSYFFRHLRSVVADDHDLIFMFDRHGSIYKGLRERYIFAKHGCCTLHLFQNVKTRFKRNDLWILYQKANQAYTKPDFNHEFARLCAQSLKVGTYLRGVGFEAWTGSHMPANKFNIMTSNNAESVNSRLVGPHRISLIGLLDGILNVMSQWFYDRRFKGEQHSNLLTPIVCRELEGNYLKSLTMVVSRLNQYEFQVHANGTTFLVNLHARTCYCNVFQVDQILCAYAIAVAKDCGVDPVTLVHPLFTTEKWKEVYRETLYPVPVFERWEVPDTVLNRACLPPDVRRKSGRPRKKRILSRGEYRGPRRRCGSCGTLGHNSRNCPNPSVGP